MDTIPTLNQFISGAAFFGNLVAGLLFLRFYRRTHDRLFAYFAVAFVIFGLIRIAFVFIDPAQEARTYFYLARLVGFSLILYAILEKNMKARTR